MNKKALIADIIKFGIIIFALFFAAIYVNMSHILFAGILALNLLAYRRGIYGMIIGILVSIVVGLVSFFVLQQDSTQTIGVAAMAISGGIPGFFAKNVHRTLNNKRMNNVYVNIVTAQILSGLNAVIQALMLKTYSVLSSSLFVVVSIIIFIVLANVNPKLILTKRSPFLNRKERSKLLND